MIFRPFVFHAWTAALFSVGTVSAQAAITVYNSEAAFVAAITAPGVDTFTGFSTTGSTPSPIIRSAGPYGYTGTVSTMSFFGAGTTVNPWLSFNTATDTITFNAFSAGVIGAGGLFFGSNSSGGFQSGSIALAATDAGGATSTQTIANATTNSVLGFVSDGALLSLTVTTIHLAGGFLWPTVDNLTFGVWMSIVDEVFVDGFE